MITTNSTSSTSSINATSTSSKRLSGLISGLDTDTLVKQLSSGTQAKIDKQVQDKQIALWKQQSYRAVTTALTDFESKYFSTSSTSSNILNASFFNSTTINNTSKFLNVTGSTSVAKNMVVTQISQLAKQASLSSNHDVSKQAITTGVISSTYAKSNVSNASMTINYDGKDYAISLDSDFTLDSTDGATNIDAITTELNDQIAKTTGLKDNVKFAVNADGKITLTNTGAPTSKMSISDGDADLLTGLGLSKGSSDTSIITGGATDATSLFSTGVLADTLSGSTLTFSLNGVSKNITFDLSDVSKYSTVDGPTPPGNLQTYLQGKLKTAFGTNSAGNNNVSVVNNGGKLSFTAADSTSIVSLDSSDKSGVLGMDGALRVYAGESNRINTNKTLEDIQSNLNGTLTADADGTYGLTINDKKFTFKNTDTIDSILSTVNNDSDANVTMSYSNINDSFSVTAKDGGSSSKIDITDGSLANALFGKSSADAGTTVSYDFTGKTSADLVGKTITIGGTTYQFLDGGSLTDSNFKSVDISNVDAAGIAAAKTVTDAAAKTVTDAAALAAATKADQDGLNATDKEAAIQAAIDAAKPAADAAIVAAKPAADAASQTAKAAAIATAFSAAASLTGYTDLATADGKVTFTASTTTPPTTALTSSSDIAGILSYTSDYVAQGGADAKLKVSFDGNAADAIDIVRSDNKFTLDGVNFELLAKTDTTVTTDAPITFSIDNKTDDLYTKIKGFVDDYNALIDLTNGKVSETKPTDSTYLPLTDAQRADMSETQVTAWETNAKKGLLNGDSILSTLSLDLRHSMTDTVASMQSALYTIGIATKANDYSANGKLTVDETALKNALTTDPDKVAALFTGTDGIAARMQTVIDKNIKTTGGEGILIAKAGIENSTTVDDSSITKSLADYDTKITELKALMETQQTQYYAKFTKLEQYMSQMNSQASIFSTTASS